MSIKDKKMIQPDEYVKEYDMYRQNLPVRYTENCMRRLFLADGVQSAPSPLGFGEILTPYKYTKGVGRAVKGYTDAVMENTLSNVYGVEDGVTEDIKKNDRSLEALKRFYPSDYNWIQDENGAPEQQNGRVLHPRNMTGEYKDMVYGGKNLRRAYFNIDLQSGEYRRPTSDEAREAYAKDGLKRPGLDGHNA